MDKKLTYEEPIIEIVEFTLKESIAASGDGAGYFEDIWEEPDIS